MIKLFAVGTLFLALVIDGPYLAKATTCNEGMSFYNKGPGISDFLDTPINPRGWTKVSPPKVHVRDLSAAESQQVQIELEKLKEIFGADALPSDIKFKVTSDQAHYDPSSRTIVLNNDAHDSINAGVLWHECGHAIADARGKLGTSGYTWEVGYDELFADTTALLRFDTKAEMQKNGAAFSKDISPKGWKDHEEHQLLVPTRSFLGRQIQKMDAETFTPELKSTIANRVLTAVSNQSRLTASVANGDPRGYRDFTETPETLNLKMIEGLKVEFAR